jgi:hypothetical protein
MKMKKLMLLFLYQAELLEKAIFKGEEFLIVKSLILSNLLIAFFTNSIEKQPA